MINSEELAICKRRGHTPEMSLGELWSQCKWCGSWLRKVSVIEEREEEPPETDKSPMLRLRHLRSDV